MFRAEQTLEDMMRRWRGLPVVVQPAPGCDIPHLAPEPMIPRVEDLAQQLGSITLAPYIVKAMALIGVRRRSGSNMFRHQISTLGILLDYKLVDPVLLKAAVIHDLFEDAPAMPGVSEEEIRRIDADGPAVYELVMEVTIRIVDGIREPKSEYLLRIMESGSPRARVLKLADRISNITALGFVHDQSFVKRFLQETRDHVLPHAERINPDMFRELSDLIENREQRLRLTGRDAAG
jgi:(p)ppGpp synthase/HD superfamily hydrolase